MGESSKRLHKTLKKKAAPLNLPTGKRRGSGDRLPPGSEMNPRRPEADGSGVRPTCGGASPGRYFAPNTGSGRAAFGLAERKSSPTSAAIVAAT